MYPLIRENSNCPVSSYKIQNVPSGKGFSNLHRLVIEMYRLKIIYTYIYYQGSPEIPAPIEEQIINALLENKCNLVATAQEIVLLAPPSSPPSQRPLVSPTTAATGNAKSSTRRSKSMHRILLTWLPVNISCNIIYIYSDEDAALREALDQSAQLVALLVEKERQDFLLAKSESQKVFALEKDSSVLLNKWRQYVEPIADEHHVFIVFLRITSGIIVGKGFWHVKTITSKVQHWSINY